jgi:hypothetical protein
VDEQRVGYIDTTRTEWYDRFFSTLEFDSAEELLAGLPEFELGAIARCRDLELFLEGWLYWVLYLRGYLEYRHTGVVDERNVYSEFMTRFYLPSGYEPPLAEAMRDPRSRLERITRRYRDCALLHQMGSNGSRNLEAVDAVAVSLCNSSRGVHRYVYEAGSSTPLPASWIDGYHRLFAARLFGVERLQCEFKASPQR